MLVGRSLRKAKSLRQGSYKNPVVIAVGKLPLLMDTTVTIAKLSLVGVVVVVVVVVVEVVLVVSFARKPTPEQLQAVLVLLAIRGLGNSAEEVTSEKKEQFCA